MKIGNTCAKGVVAALGLLATTAGAATLNTNREEVLAYFARHVDGLTLENATFEVAGGATDPRPAVVRDDVK